MVYDQLYILSYLKTGNAKVVDKKREVRVRKKEESERPFVRKAVLTNLLTLLRKSGNESWMYS